MKLIKQFWLITALLILTNVIVFLSVGDGTFLSYFSDLMPIISAIIGCYGIYKAYSGFKSFDNIKLAWLLLLTGIGFDLVAESLYAFMDLGLAMDMNELFPSVADLFWCLAYPAFLSGLIILFFAYLKSGFPFGSIKLHVIWITLFVLLAVSMVYFILIPIVQDSETDFLSKAVSMIYPVGDILIISITMILFFLIRQFGTGPATKPWLLLSLGFLQFTISDLSYAFMEWQSSYGAGSFIDIGWNLGYMIFGLAGLYQSNLIHSIHENLKK